MIRSGQELRSALTPIFFIIFIFLFSAIFQDGKAKSPLCVPCVCKLCLGQAIVVMIQSGRDLKNIKPIAFPHRKVAFLLIELLVFATLQNVNATYVVVAIVSCNAPQASSRPNSSREDPNRTRARTHRAYPLPAPHTRLPRAYSIFLLVISFGRYFKTK